MQINGRLIAGTAAAVALLFPTEAWAYLDPGSGSLIFQTLVATLAGVAYGVRVYWSRIRALFGRRTDTSTPEVGRRDGGDSDSAH